MTPAEREEGILLEFEHGSPSNIAVRTEPRKGKKRLCVITNVTGNIRCNVSIGAAGTGG
jgi:hypothetical protein